MVVPSTSTIVPVWVLPPVRLPVPPVPAPPVPVPPRMNTPGKLPPANPVRPVLFLAALLDEPKFFCTSTPPRKPTTIRATAPRATVARFRHRVPAAVASSVDRSSVNGSEASSSAMPSSVSRASCPVVTASRSAVFASSSTVTSEAVTGSTCVSSASTGVMGAVCTGISLLITQCLNRTQGRGAAGRIGTEEEPNGDRDAQRQRDRARDDHRRHADDGEPAADQGRGDTEQATQDGEHGRLHHELGHDGAPAG